jgi:hypothetical protein
MAKTKKRGAARKNSAKRAKASVKPARKKTAKKTTKRAAAKPKAKSNRRRASKSVTKPAAEEMRPLEVAVMEKPVELEKPVEITVIAAVEAPVPAVVGLEETVEVATSTPAGGEREEGARPALDPWSGADEPAEKKVP